MSKSKIIDSFDVTDGQRPVGRCLRHGSGFECYDPAGGYLFKAETRSEARRLLLDHDQQERAQARFADDGGAAQ